MYDHHFPLVKSELAKRKQKNGIITPAETITSETCSAQMLSGPLEEYINQAWQEGIDILAVEDGASTHFKGKSAELCTLIDIPNITHPPSSPDLNPIEHAWGYITAQLRKQRPKPTSQNDLWIHIQQLWDGIPQETINRWCLSMEKRRDRVEAAKGDPIKGWA